MKSLPYNFNFLQGLIPWSVVAQALNPFSQSLDRRTAATPALAGLREAPFCSQFLLYTPRASSSSLAFKILLPPSWQAYPGGVGGWYDQEKVAGREDSLVGESWCSGPHSHHYCAHRYFLHFRAGQCSESQTILFLVFIWVVFKEGVYGPTFVKDSLRGQKFLHGSVPSLGLLLRVKGCSRSLRQVPACLR